MIEHSRQTPLDTSDPLDAPMEQVLAALEEYLEESARDSAAGPAMQNRAQAACAAIRIARGEWWRLGLELGALRQRVARLEGEVARLERYVGKVAGALDESEWVTGA